MTEEKSNTIFLGILIGFILALGLMWYFKDNRAPTWWCYYLPESEANYCENLYDKAVKKIDNMTTDDQQQCSPDYMGGCN